MILPRVDLPAPFSPTSACTVPRSMARSMPCSACTPPKRLSMPRASTWGWAPPGAQPPGPSVMSLPLRLELVHVLLRDDRAVRRQGRLLLVVFHRLRHRLAAHGLDRDVARDLAHGVRDIGIVGPEAPLFDGLVTAL